MPALARNTSTLPALSSVQISREGRVEMLRRSPRCIPARRPAMVRPRSAPRRRRPAASPAGCSPPVPPRFASVRGTGRPDGPNCRAAAQQRSSGGKTSRFRNSIIAEDLLPECHRESKGGAETLLGGERPARQVRVRGHVGDPAGCTASPDGSGQLLPQSQRPLRQADSKSAVFVAGDGQTSTQPQDALVPVHFPKDADGPSQFLAEGLQNSFAGLGLGRRFGQHLRRRLAGGPNAVRPR